MKATGPGMNNRRHVSPAIKNNLQRILPVHYGWNIYGYGCTVACFRIDHDVARVLFDDGKTGGEAKTHAFYLPLWCSSTFTSGRSSAIFHSVFVFKPLKASLTDWVIRSRIGMILLRGLPPLEKSMSSCVRSRLTLVQNIFCERRLRKVRQVGKRVLGKHNHSR